MLARWREELIQRPFTDVRDFYERVQPEGPEALNLIRCDVFDCFGSSRTEHFIHGWLDQRARVSCKPKLPAARRPKLRRAARLRRR